MGFSVVNHLFYAIFYTPLVILWDCVSYWVVSYWVLYGGSGMGLNVCIGTTHILILYCCGSV